MSLWETLSHIASNMTDPWYVHGDFNSVLTPYGRIGGDVVADFEIKDFTDCFSQCAL